MIGIIANSLLHLSSPLFTLLPGDIPAGLTRHLKILSNNEASPALNQSDLTALLLWNLATFLLWDLVAGLLWNTATVLLGHRDISAVLTRNLPAVLLWHLQYAGK